MNAQKWATRAAAAGGEYASGAASPRRSWQASAAASKDNYAAGVNTAISEGRYEKGISKAGDAKWNKGIQEKGRARYQQGVGIAQAEYQAGYAPYAAKLGSVTLPPRGPKGTNYGRVQAVGEALREAKKTI